MLVRYEELVLSPEPLLRELLDWLGEPWSDRVLQHHSVQTGRGGRVTVEGKNRIDDPIDVSRIDKWFRTLPEARRPALARRLGRLGEFYGYSMDDPAVLGSLSADGTLLIRGTDIDARIDEFPDLDLRAEPEPPLAERFYHPGRMQLHSVLEPKTPPAQAQETEPGVLVVRGESSRAAPARRLHPLGRRVVRRFRRAS